jgi:hypothetical protein
VYHNLREYGRVDHVDIGIVAQAVTTAIAEVWDSRRTRVS